MAKQLRLEIIFGSADRLSPALRRITQSSRAADQALKRTRDELKKLNDQQKQVDGYRKQKQALVDQRQTMKEQAEALKDVQEKIKKLRQEMAINPSDKLSKEFDKATKEAKKLKDEYNKSMTKFGEMRVELKRTSEEMKEGGLSTKNLAAHQLELRRRTDQANAELERQRQALRNLQNAQQNYQRHSQNVRNVGMAGLMMAGTGAAAMYQLAKPINESKRVDVEANRIAALGLGDDVSNKAIKFAQAMDTFGTSMYDNMTLVRDGITIFSDLHHAEMVAPTLAKMKFGNHAMFGHEKGEENERAFMDMLKVIELRGGLKSEKAFQDQANKIQQVITATGGRVQGSEWLNAIKTGGIAVKGLTDEALYYKMESIVQEWGGFRYGTAAMSAYQNIYQGRTTKRAANNMERLGLIADPSKLKHDKAGQIAFLDVGAIKGAELFKKDQFAWMEQVLLPTLAAKGITEKGDVLDAIGSIFTNRTASNLFGDMYLQRDIINKSAKMNAGADNVDQLYSKAMNTTAGQELETKAKLNDAYLRFGQTILPIYTKALQIATGVLQNFTQWMERNPTQAKILGTALVGLAAGLVAIGGLLLVFSPLILGMLSLRLMMVTLGAQGSTLSFVLKMLISPFKLIGNALVFLRFQLLQNIVAVWRYSVSILGMSLNVVKAAATMAASKIIPFLTMLKTQFITGAVAAWSFLAPFLPIIIAVGLLATAAYLIYKNWEPIKEFFSGIWSHISSGASTAWEWVSSSASNAWNKTKLVFSPAGSWFSARWNDIKSAFDNGIGGVSTLILNWSPIGLFYQVFAKVLSWFGIELPAKFSEFGRNIIDGLINGLNSGFEKLKTVWVTINSYMPDWMKKKNEIRSPSRLFKRLGGHIMEDWQIGIQDGLPSLQNIFGQALGIMDTAQLAYANAPTLPEIIDAPNVINTPLAAGSAKNKVVTIEGDQITIHVHQTPGQSNSNLMQDVRAVLMQFEREKMARIRTSMQDEG